MKSFKKIICLLLTALLIVTAPLSASAIGADAPQAQTAAVNFDPLINAFSSVFYSVRRFFGGIFGVYKFQDACTAEVKIPAAVLETGFIPQGMCFLDGEGWFVVSGYMQDGSVSKLCMIKDDGSEYKLLPLRNVGGSDYTGHAGGVATDGKNLFITSGKYAHRLKVADLLAAKNGSTMRFLDRFNTGTNASFAFCDNNMLWVGEFSTLDGSYTTDEAHHIKVSLLRENHSWCVGFAINKNLDSSIAYTPGSSDVVVPNVVLSIPHKVQGFAVLPDGSMALSTSYGSIFDSKLLVYPNVMNSEPDGEVTINSTAVPVWYLTSANRSESYTMPMLMEGIDIAGGRLCMLFESCSNKFSDAPQRVDDILSCDIADL